MFNWVKGLRHFGLMGIICSFTLALSSAAHAQTFNTTNLSSNTASKASYPTMVVDRDGNLDLAWVDSAKGIMFARSIDGKTFPTPVPVQVQPATGAPVLPAFQPQMAVYLTQTNVVEIVWAAPDPASTPAATTYDVFAARSNDSGVSFTTTPIAISTTATTPTGVPLAGPPRLAFDFSGKTNVVWGQHDILISQAQDGLNFGPPVSLVPPVVPPHASAPLDTGGPRVIGDPSHNIFVAWTDEANKNAADSYCISTEPTDGTPVPNTDGGFVFINETLAGDTFNAAATRNLSMTDWKGVATKFPNGFFGCSYDNLILFTDKVGLVHLLWSDDSPIEDVLTSQIKTNSTFSFPFNLASLSAAAPKIAVDQNVGSPTYGTFYVVWSGGPTGGTNSEGIFFKRSDDSGQTFTPTISIASSGAFAPAYPEVAVDSKGNVSVAWEQAHKAIAADGSDTFDVFLAGSPDNGATFPTLSQVSTNPSVLCIAAGNPPTTPNTTTCGTVQLGLDVKSSPVMAWVDQANPSAVANIDFAAKSGNDFTITLPAPSQDALPGQTAAFTVNTAAIGTFSGSVTLGCRNFGVPAANLTCSFAGGTINVGQSATVNVALPATMAAGPVTFTINGESGGTTHGVTATINVGTSPTSGFSIAVSASSASALAGGSATFNVQITPANGFNQPVMLSCSGLPAGATCSFNPAAATSTSTLTVSTQGSVAANSYPFTVMGTSGAATSSKSATLIIGTITASISPSSATIAVLSSANFTLNLSSANGFNGTVSLDCPGLPAGITCTFNPASMSVPGSTTLTVAVSAKPTGSLVYNGPRDLDGLGLQRNAVWSIAFVALALILSGMIAARRRQTPMPLARGFAVMALVLVLAVGLISCSGGKTSTSSSGGTGGGASNPFTGQITVRAQSGGAATNLSTMSITVP